jgi:hypothetical protein
MAETRSNGDDRLEESMRDLAKAQASLIQTQATLTLSQAAFQKEMADFHREMASLRRETNERFARVEAILIEHSRILRGLPEAVREKIGFKAPENAEPST